MRCGHIKYLAFLLEAILLEIHVILHLNEGLVLLKLSAGKRLLEHISD